MLIDFFTIQESQAPHISKGLYFTMIAILIFFLYLTYRLRDSDRYGQIFKGLQWLQVVTLYSWYLLAAFSWQLSLPLYHCRIAILGILLLPNQNKWKPYLALMGLLGSLVSFVYPVLDTYAFPHLTQFSFVLGHLALMVNSFLYLLKHFDLSSYRFKNQFAFLAVINLVILTVSIVTGGDYGFMRHLPIIESDHIILNYLIMTGLFAAVTYGLGHMVARIQARTSLIEEKPLSEI